jgi:hypothetical protein
MENLLSDFYYFCVNHKEIPCFKGLWDFEVLEIYEPIGIID